MMRSLWSAATGMIAQQLNVDTIAHNLANVNTTGFKRQRVDFQDLMYQTLRMPGSPSTENIQLPTGIQVGLGTRVASTVKSFAQGALAQTGNPLDLAIEGDGFFQVNLPSGEAAYTRSGALKQDSDGNIVTSDGYLLEPPIAIPSDATEISIRDDGTVAVLQPGSTDPAVIGNMQLVMFPNPAGLANVGHGLLRATAASGDPTVGTPGMSGLGIITQGTLELSNVQVVEEMVNMIVAQRAYEASSQAIKVADDMLQTANRVQQ